MARKKKDITISGDPENRDIGKTFRITEMAAWRGEKWAFRALQALGASGFQIPADPKSMSAAKLATLGLEALSKADFEIVEKLLDEMLTCVEHVSPSNPNIVIPLQADHHIDEISTVLAIRGAWLELHLGFFMGALNRTSASKAENAPPTA